MQNLVVLNRLCEMAFDISSQAGNMIFNRFCIDEDAAFELSAVHSAKKLSSPHLDGEIIENNFISMIEKVIGSALQMHAENVILKPNKELQTHFVCVGRFMYIEDILKPIILKKMKKYKIKSVMVTNIYMERRKLITKENMESHYKGMVPMMSVHEDLEQLFEGLQLGNERDEEVETYFLPKLTEEEMELVEKKEPTYFETFHYSWNPDVEELSPGYRVELFEKNFSESDSRFVQGLCRRKTFTIKNSLSQTILNSCYLQ